MPSPLEPVRAARAVFAKQKAFAEHCFAQLDDTQFFTEPYPGHNSVGVIAQHVAGNLKSRWTNFLSEDGDKPWRNREGEFAPPPEGDHAAARTRIMAAWEEGWHILFATLDGLTDADMDRTVAIRGQAHSIPLALARQLDHYGHHVGQIATIARGHVGTDQWQWLTPPPGGTADLHKSLGYEAKR